MEMIKRSLEHDALEGRKLLDEMDAAKSRGAMEELSGRAEAAEMMRRERAAIEMDGRNRHQRRRAKKLQRA